jgi:FkbM family methyltransferase
MADTRLAVRITEGIANFLVAVSNCGPASAVQIFVASRWSTRLRSVRIRRLDISFSFRSRLDHGVVSHFYRPGYRIYDPTDRIRWIIDAGANIGDETVKFRHFHPEAHIIAIEVDDANIAILRRNVAHDPRIHIERRALWPRGGETVELAFGATPEATRALPTSNGSIETISLGELQEKYGFHRIDILKLDIEGAEARLFEEGATDWMAIVDVLIMEVADHESPSGLQRLLRAFPADVNCTVAGENIVAIRTDRDLSATRYRYL